MPHRVRTVSRGPGRWQRLVLAAMEEAGPLAYVCVSGVARDALGRPMTGSEYRALIRASWLLAGRGALHLGKPLAVDCLGRTSARLLAWCCANCSFAGAGEHIPALPCFWCEKVTTQRNYGDHPDCGAHRATPPCAACGGSASYAYGADGVCRGCLEAALQSLPEAARRAAAGVVLG